VDLLLLVGAGIIAGAVNAAVGSGTLLTYPLLLAYGLPPVVANGTNSAGLAPGNLFGALGYRREMAGRRREVVPLALAIGGGALVGAILVVALLTVPAATAELLTRRLSRVIPLAMAIGVAASAIGYLAARHWGTNAGGMIAVVLGLGYVAAAVAAPGDGIAARAASRVALGWRVAREDRLAALWRAEEAGAAPPGPRGIVERLAGAGLVAEGLLRHDDGARLTAAGRDAARLVVRSHRLWEAWLGRNVAIPLDHLHPPAEWIEHHLGAAVRGRLAEDLGVDDGDPHGRDIPAEEEGG